MREIQPSSHEHRLPPESEMRNPAVCHLSIEREGRTEAACAVNCEADESSHDPRDVTCPQCLMTLPFPYGVA